MKKAEVIKYMQEKAEEGYLTHFLLLELYNDEEEIPDEMVDLACHLPEPPKPYILHGSPEMIKQLNQACVDFMRYLAQKQIADESMKKICKS